MGLTTHGELRAVGRSLRVAIDAAAEWETANSDEEGAEALRQAFAYAQVAFTDLKNVITEMHSLLATINKRT